MGIKRIVFFNCEKEVDKYLSDSKNANIASDIFIALNPNIYSYIKEKGCAAQSSLSYFNSDSHKMALERSRLLTEWLRANSEFLDLGSGIKQAFTDAFVFWSRFAAHYCLWSIEVILNIFR